MLTRLFRQRRRIAVMLIAAMLAGAVTSGGGREPLLFALAGLALASLILLLAPNRRRWIEALGIGLLPASLLNLPPVGFILATVAMASLAHLVVHSRWSDRTGLRLGLISHRVSRVAASPAQVWTALIPGEGHPDDHWSGTLTDYDHDPDDPLTTYLRFRTPDGLHEEVTVTFLTHIPQQSCRYIIERAGEGLAEAGTMIIDIAAIGPRHSQITSRLQFDALPPRVAFGRWLDDTFGDEWDSFAATVSARRDWSIHGLQRAKLAAA